MHVEVTRILTSWLRDSENGVNALLAALPHDRIATPDEDEPGDVVEEALPGTVEIYNDVDYDIAQGVLGVDPPTVPSLVVVADSAPEVTDIRMPVKPGHQMEMLVGIGYYATKDYRKDAVVAGDYTLRAVKQCLRRYNEPARHRQLRELNDILLARIDSVTIQRVGGGTVQNSALLGFVLADVTVVDKAP